MIQRAQRLIFSSFLQYLNVDKKGCIFHPKLNKAPSSERTIAGSDFYASLKREKLCFNLRRKIEIKMNYFKQ